MAVSSIPIGDANDNFQPRRQQWETEPTTDRHVEAFPQAQPYDVTGSGGAFAANIDGFMDEPSITSGEGPK